VNIVTFCAIFTHDYLKQAKFVKHWDLLGEQIILQSLFPALERTIFTTLCVRYLTTLSVTKNDPGFDPGSGHVGFVVDKVALGHVFSVYFGFPCQSSFHRLLHNHYHLSSGAGTIGQHWPTYQVDSVSPHPEKLKKKKTELTPWRS
jgi:hypothetical protein